MKLEVQDLIEFVLSSEGGVGKSVAHRVASYFSSIDEFVSCTEEQLAGLRTAAGRPLQIAEADIKKILVVSRSGMFPVGMTLADNYIMALTRDFVRRQVKNISSLDLDSLNVNPMLVHSLNLKSPLELLEFNVNAAASRSIVTSMGYFVQGLLEVTSNDVERVKSGWDLVKHGSDGTDHWIQVKSGTNDMDKDQIMYWLKEIQKVESGGDRGYIGMTYGLRDNPTVSLSLMRTYLPDMEIRTLVGRELWDFLSGDKHFHERLFDDLRIAAAGVLGSKSIQETINDCVEKIHGEFKRRFGEGRQGLDRYVRSIF